MRSEEKCSTNKKRSFGEWLKKVKPSYQWSPEHLVLIREQLARVLDPNDPLDRLMVFLPPRHGKSELITIHWPAYVLEMLPGFRWIIGSYATGLSTRFSRRTRSIAQERIELNPERQAANDWETAEGGGVRAVGVGSGVTGHGAGGILIDDPVKSRAEANSKTYRDACYEWYLDDLSTRLEPGGFIVLVMCMTGDTPVLMGDGTEKPLKEVRAGDVVKSYDRGQIVNSKVLNWANQGVDSTYGMRMKSGIIVRANARHPFLVERNGELKWLRMAAIRKGDNILRVTGASGRELSAQRRDAQSPQNAKDGVITTTENGADITATGRPQQIQRRIVRGVSRIGMALLVSNMTAWLKNKTASVPSAAKLLRMKILALTGRTSSVSTIATTPIALEDCSVMTAISLLVTGKRQKSSKQRRNTYGIRLDEVADIFDGGAECVYDIQVERTENFIANGLVSHNTRWHEDDLAGRILASEEGKDWYVLRLAALAESTKGAGEPDPLGREPGAALWPSRYSIENLLRIKSRLLSSFDALFQGRPTSAEGGIIKKDWIKRYSEFDSEVILTVQSWDCANKGNVENDFSVCTTWKVTRLKIYLVAEWRKQVNYPDLKRACAAEYNQHKPDVVLIEDKGNGIALIQELKEETAVPVIAVEPVGDKVSRLAVQSISYETGQVLHPEPAVASWVIDFETEITTIPNAPNDDRGDSVSQAIAYISKTGNGFTFHSAGQSIQLDDAPGESKGEIDLAHGFGRITSGTNLTGF